jgi:hypothetical protein
MSLPPQEGPPVPDETRRVPVALGPDDEQALGRRAVGSARRRCGAEPECLAIRRALGADRPRR